MAYIQTLEFRLSERIRGYEIYYAVPNSQRKTHTGLSGRTAMFVMKGDEIVFIPKNYRSQYQARNQCSNWIEEQLKEEDSLCY